MKYGIYNILNLKFDCLEGKLTFRLETIASLFSLLPSMEIDLPTEQGLKYLKSS